MSLDGGGIGESAKGAVVVVVGTAAAVDEMSSDQPAGDNVLDLAPSDAQRGQLKSRAEVGFERNTDQQREKPTEARDDLGRPVIGGEIKMLIGHPKSGPQQAVGARFSLDTKHMLLVGGRDVGPDTGLGGKPSRAKQLTSNEAKNSRQLQEEEEHESSMLKTSKGRLRQFLILILFIIGLIVCITSIICILLLPAFVSNQISKRLVLKNNSLLLERWSKPNVPMYFKVWLFDVKNARELTDRKGARPVLQEIGPFVFNLRRQKDVISFAGDNLYYTERKVYHFNRELSCCSINTTVTVPNIPLVAVVDRALGYNLPLLGRFVPRLINRAIQSLREQLFVNKQVGELLFDGYEVELLKMVSRIGSIVGLPQQSQRFGLLKGRNNTWRPDQDGVFAINTGARDRRQFGRVSSWNSYKQLPFWPAGQCNVINGSDGTLFPPPISNQRPLHIFNPELCRTVNLVYQRPSDVQSIQAYRFTLNPLNFAHTMSAAHHHHHQQQQQQPPPPPPPQTTNAQPAAARDDTRRPPAAASSLDRQPSVESQERLVRVAQVANERTPAQRNPQVCFCDRKSTKLGQTSVCEFDGLIDLSKCTKQAQVVFGSMPHFHQADSRLLSQVVGLQPNASKHTTYLDIEPNTGLVLGGKRRVQLNLLIKHNNEVDGFENIQDMLVPLVWFEESAQITEESAKKFKSLYTDRVRLINLVLMSLFAASLLLLLIDARLLMATRYWRRFKLFKGYANTGPPDADGNAKFSTPARPARPATTEPGPKSNGPAKRRRRRPSSSLASRDNTGQQHDYLYPHAHQGFLYSSSLSSSAEGHYEPLALSGQPAPGSRRIQIAQSETECDGNSAKRSDSPLLEPNTGTSDTESISSSSPELHKWSAKRFGRSVAMYDDHVRNSNNSFHYGPASANAAKTPTNAMALNAASQATRTQANGNISRLLINS